MNHLSPLSKTLTDIGPTTSEHCSRPEQRDQLIASIPQQLQSQNLRNVASTAAETFSPVRRTFPGSRRTAGREAAFLGTPISVVIKHEDRVVNVRTIYSLSPRRSSLLVPTSSTTASAFAGLS